MPYRPLESISWIATRTSPHDGHVRAGGSPGGFEVSSGSGPRSSATGTLPGDAVGSTSTRRKLGSTAPCRVVPQLQQTSNSGSMSLRHLAHVQGSPFGASCSGRRARRARRGLPRREARPREPLRPAQARRESARRAAAAHPGDGGASRTGAARRRSGRWTGRRGRPNRTSRRSTSPCRKPPNGASSYRGGPSSARGVSRRRVRDRARRGRARRAAGTPWRTCDRGASHADPTGPTSRRRARPDAGVAANA